MRPDGAGMRRCPRPSEARETIGRECPAATRGLLLQFLQGVRTDSLLESRGARRSECYLRPDGAWAFELVGFCLLAS
jgi:hypothetical protein